MKVNIEAEGRGVILVKIRYETDIYRCFASSKLFWSFVIVPLYRIRKDAQMRALSYPKSQNV